ncbi:epsilon-sarcoglycan-like isoform X1 [Argiope bruennichi]|uniref:epsilon-sarcoglycan-like isoform X1 n=1 Tax=Argiope bruennichi TaxID=94029 RepID=UPI002493D611|nr:epsilon-sarcoglycan-like isoform X1 [Argiope bruennichi]
MKMFLLNLICLCLCTEAFGIDPKPMSVLSTEAFFIPISYEWFPKFQKDDPLEFTASLMDMPDLPNWMFSHPMNSSNAYLYGSAVEAGTVNIEITALNKNNFDTASAVLELSVQPREKIFQYEVEMKFVNLNVDDMFRSGRLNRLVEVFKTSLWKESDDIYITKVVSSLDVGGRLPLNPRMKEGVVVRIGGTSPFSRDLEDLDREVIPLRNRSPCPPDYKRTSVEHLFRSRNFIADWCSFRLHSEKHQRNVGSSDGWSDHPYSSIPLTSDEYSPQISDLPRRDLLIDFIVSIIIPTTIVGVVSLILTCIVCCNKDGLDKANDGTSLQLDQYNGVPLGSNQINRLHGKRDSSMQRSGSIPVSSFPNSRTDSPASTLPKGCTLRGSSRTGTLRSVMQPPPPPYATSSYPPSYVGSARNVAMPPQ